MIWKKNEKKGCLISLIILISGFICLSIGIIYKIHILHTLGFLLPVYGGTIYKQLTIKDENKKWNLKKHLMMIVSLILITLFFTLIAYRKLW